MTAEPGDQAAAVGGGRLRAAHADREQVIAVLKAAFVQGMLAKDEFDERVGQAFAARTYADLAAVTADLPAIPVTAQPAKPARVADGRPVVQPGKAAVVGTVLYAGVWSFALVPSWPTDVDGDPQAALIILLFVTTLIYLILLATAAGYAIAGWREKRSHGQLPRRPGPRAGGPASSRLPPADPDGQLPLADPGHQQIAEAAQRSRPGSSSPTRWSFRPGPQGWSTITITAVTP